jgi:hypothetical protein
VIIEEQSLGDIYIEREKRQMKGGWIWSVHSVYLYGQSVIAEMPEVLVCLLSNMRPWVQMPVHLKKKEIKKRKYSPYILITNLKV